MSDVSFFIFPVKLVHVGVSFKQILGVSKNKC